MQRKVEPRIDAVIRDLANVSVRARPCVKRVREAITDCIEVCFQEQDRQQAKRNANAGRK